MTVTETVGSIVSNPLLLILSLLVMSGLALFFARFTFRNLRAQRRLHDIRHRQRKEFWGYE